MRLRACILAGRVAIPVGSAVTSWHHPAGRSPRRASSRDGTAMVPDLARGGHRLCRSACPAAFRVPIFFPDLPMSPRLALARVALRGTPAASRTSRRAAGDPQCGSAECSGGGQPARPHVQHQDPAGLCPARLVHLSSVWEMLRKVSLLDEPARGLLHSVEREPDIHSRSDPRESRRPCNEALRLLSEQRTAGYGAYHCRSSTS